MKKHQKGSLNKHKTSLQGILAQDFFLHKARLDCMGRLLLALISEKTVNFVSLSLAFQGTAKAESHYRRIKRFFAEVSLDKLIVARLILAMLPPPPYIVCIDRSNWQFGKLEINFLVTAIAHRGIAFPVVWCLLETSGNSSSDERIDVLQDLLKIIAVKDIAFVTADREFIGQTWLGYLDKRGIAFSIRIRKNSLCDKLTPVYSLFTHLPEGHLRVLHNAYELHGCQLRLAGVRLEKEYFIIASNRQPGKAFIAYKQRWQIEMLFAALKTTGFDIEASHLRHLDRLETLFSLLALAFSWAHLVGEWLHDAKIHVLKLKSHLRLAKSFFRHGLDHLRHLIKNLPIAHDNLAFCIQLLSRT